MNWLVIRTQVLKHLPEARHGERERSKRQVGGGTAVRKAMEKSTYVWVIERKKVRGDDLIEYFLSTGVRSTF